MGMNRLPPTTNYLQRAAATTTATPPAPVAAAPAAAAPHREEASHAHGHSHHAHGHAQHGHAAHDAHAGRPSRPRRPPKPAKPKKTRKNSPAAPSDDEEPEIHDAGEHQTGLAPLSFDGGHRDGGDDDAEGGDERSRHDRLARVRQHADEAATGAGAAGLGRLPRLHGGAQARLAVERFAQRACDVVAQGAPDMGRQLKLLQLRLLKETPGVRRLDRGGIARVRQLLASHMPRSRERAGRPAGPESVERIANGNLMLVMQLLQLQVPMTRQQREQSIARLAVQTHTGSR